MSVFKIVHVPVLEVSDARAMHHYTMFSTSTVGTEAHVASITIMVTDGSYC